MYVFDYTALLVSLIKVTYYVQNMHQIISAKLFKVLNSKVHPAPRVLKKECELVIIAKALSCLLLGWPKFVCSMNTLFIIVTGENRKRVTYFIKN